MRGEQRTEAQERNEIPKLRADTARKFSFEGTLGLRVLDNFSQYFIFLFFLFPDTFVVDNNGRGCDILSHTKGPGRVTPTLHSAG